MPGHLTGHYDFRRRADEVISRESKEAMKQKGRQAAQRMTDGQATGDKVGRAAHQLANRIR
jgi:hypothetical protein